MARRWDGPGPAGPQPWMNPVPLPANGFAPMHAMGYQAPGGWAQPQPALIQQPLLQPPTARTATPFQAPHLASQAQSHHPQSALLQTPHPQNSHHIPHAPTTTTSTTTITTSTSSHSSSHTSSHSSSHTSSHSSSHASSHTSSHSSQASSNPTPLPAIVPTQAGDLEQRRKERDKRERERKEKEQRKQRELEMQKREANKNQISAATSKESKQHNLLRIPTEFLCKMQFRNKLPDIPFDPKLLSLNLDTQRYTKCIIGSSLENSYKHSLFTEPDLGIPINLIDANIYKIPPGQSKQLAPEDQLLVDANVAATPRKGVVSGVAKERPRPTVTWLRKTNYLCNEEEIPQFKAKGVEAQPAMYKLQRTQRDLNTLEGQLQSVENTFEAVKRIPTHPTNPNLRPVEILPIFPDFTLWPNSYTEVVFDADPLLILPPEKVESMDEEDVQNLRNNAIVRGIKGHQLVAFITPTRKRTREVEEGEEEEYEQVHAYHFDVAKDADLEDNYFFVFTPDAVYYNELATRVKLRKVQSKEEKEQLLNIPRPSGVTVAREAMSDATHSERAERLSDMLQPASTDESADM